MADSAPNPKVEDVLSSVRRLVSGEVQRRTSRPSQPAGEAGALVLTEAHRVAEKPKPAPGPEARKRSLEERIAELEAAVDRGSEEFEPDGSEDPSQHRPDRIVYTRPPSSDEVSERATLRLSQIELIETEPASEEPESRVGASVPFRRETSRTPSEAPMAEDVLPQPTTGEVRAFTNPDDVVARIEARIEGGVQQVKARSPAKGDTADATPRRQDNMLREEPNDPADDFEMALSKAVSAPVSPSESDDSSEEASGDFLDQDEVLAFVDPASEIAPAGEPASETEEESPVAFETPEPASADDEGDDDAPAVAAAALDSLPDEEALRRLVARMIREELQGHLGERITSNVRKLVRREVMRALDSRDLM